MIVDCHAHITHPDVLSRFPAPPSLGDVDGIIEDKLAAGIGLSIIGSPAGAGPLAPVPGFDHDNQSVEALKRFHDWLAEVVAARRDHLRAYAFCHPFADDKTLAATAETVKAGGFVGLITVSSAQGEYLDSPRAAGFFALAEELDVPVLVHPGPKPAAAQGIKDYGLIEMVGRYSDVMISLAAVVLSGVLERHPGLRLVAASGAGALGQLAQRIDWAQRPPYWAPRQAWPALLSGKDIAAGPRHEVHTEAPASQLLRRLYVDTTADSTHAHLANHGVFGAEHMLFGTDSPPMPVNFTKKVNDIGGLPIPEPDSTAILGGNAAKLFRLEEAVVGAKP